MLHKLVVLSVFISTKITCGSQTNDSECIQNCVVLRKEKSNLDNKDVKHFALKKIESLSFWSYSSSVNT